MPSEIMDQRGLSSIYGSSPFPEEIRFPTERQVGFWKSDSMPSHHVKDQTAKVNLDIHMLQHERPSSLPTASRKVMDQDSGSRSNLYAQQPASVFREGNNLGLNGAHYENSLFSSSLSDIFTTKLRLSTNEANCGQSVDAVTSHIEEEEPLESLKEIEARTIGNLLPDDDDLLSGVFEELGYVCHSNTGDEIEDFDLFSSGGGMELEADDVVNGYGGIPNGQQGCSNGSLAGEHPYGEHPSRTLFVRNINSNVEDSELRVLFEQYGDIRTLYTACKHRGFVMISYYDIRAARNAMRALQNKPLRHRKLDIHFSIPKDNPSEKDINQGTLVVFNLDSSVSNDELRQIFGVYGEIKEIRETPHKRHHKFIEFYDVRAAEAALRALNRSDIGGKRIKLEPSRPGGARRCLMQQLSPEMDQEEDDGCQQGCSPIGSPSACYGSLPHGATAATVDNGAIQTLHSAIRVPINPFPENEFHGLSSSITQTVSSPIRVGSVGSHGNQPGLGEPNQSIGRTKFDFQGMQAFQPHSLPEFPHGLANGGIPYNSPGTMSAIAASLNSGSAEGLDARNMQRIGLGGLSRHSFDLKDSVFGASGNGSCPLHGHQYIWSNSHSYQPSPGPMLWPNSPSFLNGVHGHPHQMHGLPRAPSHMMSTILPLSHHQHHVGSAPAVNPSLWDRRHAYGGDSAEASCFHPGSLGTIGFSGNPTLHPLELASQSMFPHVAGNCIDPSMSPVNVGMPSPQQRMNMFPGRNPMIPSMPNSFDSPTEHRVRGRRGESISNQPDNKKQYELDIDRIIRGEDTRTTLMIKNIPNKYTSKMLLAAIDEHHKGTYDFIYLPIDFKNKCNVGYAFINMIDPMQIVPFYQAFNGKKWEKFNSEKVASLAYARIQGKAALIAHFQNSSLMNEDKRCRPILFHSDGPNAGDQEPFPMGVNIRSRSGKTRTNSNEETHQGSTFSASANGEVSCNGIESSSGSSKDSE